jgi:hypothetical protein
MKIRDVTDPQELLLAQLDEVRRRNAAMRETIRQNRATLRGGIAEEARLEAELVELAIKKVEI